MEFLLSLFDPLAWSQFIGHYWLFLLIGYIIVILTFGRKNIKRQQWKDQIFKEGLKHYYKKKRKKYWR